MYGWKKNLYVLNGIDDDYFWPYDEIEEVLWHKAIVEREKSDIDQLVVIGLNTFKALSTLVIPSKTSSNRNPLRVCFSFNWHWFG